MTQLKAINSPKASQSLQIVLLQPGSAFRRFDDVQASGALRPANALGQLI